MNKIHKCEPSLEELYKITDELQSEGIEGNFGDRWEIGKKLHAINVQIKRHIDE